MNAPQEIQLSRNVGRLGRLDLPGAGQVRLVGTMAYIGHIPNRERLGTSIVDVSDPRDPKVISQVFLDDDESHSHKARVVGDIMIVNHERNMTPIGRKADELPGARTALVASLGREPTHAELAAKIGVSEADIPVVEAAQKKGYHLGGFRVYDISDRSKPRQLVHHRTGGIGVHRFDMDSNYAYISTEMEGFTGNILVNYSLANPERPEEGLVFAGRVVEDFKLTSGTFVHVGTLRVAAIAAASPVIQDALVAGQDREYVALLAWPNLGACRVLCGKPDATLEQVVHEPAVIQAVRAGLATHNASATGSSMRIARVMLMTEPPSVDGNELTDKGYINQRAGLERRAALVERLYAAQPDAEVIVIV